MQYERAEGNGLIYLVCCAENTTDESEVPLCSKITSQPFTALLCVCI